MEMRIRSHARSRISAVRSAEVMGARQINVLSRSSISRFAFVRDAVAVRLLTALVSVELLSVKFRLMMVAVTS